MDKDNYRIQYRIVEEGRITKKSSAWVQLKLRIACDSSGGLYHSIDEDEFFMSLATAKKLLEDVKTNHVGVYSPKGEDNQITGVFGDLAEFRIVKVPAEYQVVKEEEVVTQEKKK